MHVLLYVCMCYYICWNACRNIFVQPQHCTQMHATHNTLHNTHVAVCVCVYGTCVLINEFVCVLRNLPTSGHNALIVDCINKIRVHESKYPGGATCCMHKYW